MIVYFHPYQGRWSNLTNMFQMGWNHQLIHVFPYLGGMIQFEEHSFQAGGNKNTNWKMMARMLQVSSRQFVW